MIFGKENGIMDTERIAFFEKLSNGFGPPGFEREVLKTVRDYVTPFSDEVSRDKMGSLLFTSKGDNERPVILLPGHVDEVGFIISGVNDKGFLTFLPLGGWFDQVLLGQRVIVRTKDEDRQGIIASKPPHLMEPDERNKVISKESMYIDLGCSNKREAEALGVRVGDPVVPSSMFSTFDKPVFPSPAKSDGSSDQSTVTSSIESEVQHLAIGKAFDDRVGAFIAAEVVRRLVSEKIKHANTVIGAATVQEEVGLRGATTAGWVAEPDVVITLEVDISGDVPGIESHKAPAVMGKGPSIITYDASMIPNSRLKELVIETANDEAIPYQLSFVARGGTDAGIIHKLRGGCPGIVIGVPTRHIHSHVGILSLEDVEYAIELVLALVTRLDANEVHNLTEL